MKKTFSIALLCVILAFSCLLSACKAPKLKKEDDGGFRNPKTDVVYYPASSNYLAKPFGTEPYARIEVNKETEGFQLFEIEGLDPERYLVSNAFTVYCAQGENLPTLQDFPCERVGIYDTQVSSNDGNITDAKAIDALKKLQKSNVFTDRANITLYIMLEGLTDDWYDLHFMGSGEYEGIYYQLKYIVCSDDIIITEIVENPNNFVDFHPGIPYELMWETYGNEQYYVAKYNFGREILCDVATNNCYKIENSLLPYITPAEDADAGQAQ
jgi:hypothetical protein